MAIGEITAKVILTVINLILCIVAVILIMISSWLFSEYFNFDHLTADKNLTLIPGCLIISVGFLLMIVGILGFIVTFRSNQCLNGLFIFLLIVLLIGLVTGSVLSYVFRKRIDAMLEKGMTNALNDYLTNVYARKEVDLMQKEFECCGVNNSSDWLDTPWYLNQSISSHEYPLSCCKDRNCTYEYPDENLFQEGCYEKLRLTFLDHLLVVASVAALCSLLLLLGVLCSAILLYRREIDIGYIGLPDSDGLQV